MGGGGFLEAGYGFDIGDIQFSVTVTGDSLSVVAALMPLDSGFRAFLSGLLTIVGLAADVVEIGGLATCALTGGTGCGVAATAGFVGTAADGAGAVLTCTAPDFHGGACGLAVGGAVLSAAPGVGGDLIQRALERADRWDEYADLFRYADFQVSALSGIVSTPLAFAQFDDSATDTHVVNFTYMGAG